MHLAAMQVYAGGNAPCGENAILFDLYYSMQWSLNIRKLAMWNAERLRIPGSKLRLYPQFDSSQSSK